MNKELHLPDSMPAINQPTLFVVSGTHECRFVGASGRTLFEEDVLTSHEHEFTDHQTEMRGPSGVTSGVGDHNQVEQHRLREFAHAIIKRIEHSVREGKVEAIYITAPDKMLAQLKKEMTPSLEKVIQKYLDGNFQKESVLEVALRCMPELEEEAKKLRDQENFSAKKHLPK